MNVREIERHAQILERRFDLASFSKRRELGTEAEKIIRKLKTHNQPIPRSLRRIEAVLEADAYDDMFDNMPV